MSSGVSWIALQQHGGEGCPALPAGSFPAMSASLLGAADSFPAMSLLGQQHPVGSELNWSFFSGGSLDGLLRAADLQPEEAPNSLCADTAGE